jgi:deoxyadenosine/deoxycytidine kinase
VELLAQETQGRMILESFADNPFLPLFYQDPERYAFTVELFFMTERYKQLQKDLATPDLFNKYIISDYLFIKSLLFARKNLGTEEYKLFQMLFSVMNNNFQSPDILVYLHRETPYLLENIKERNRSYEQEIEEDYLLKIQNSYFEYLRNITSYPVLILDLKDMDFVHNQQNYETLKFLLSKKYMPGVHRMVVSS